MSMQLNKISLVLVQVAHNDTQHNAHISRTSMKSISLNKPLRFQIGVNCIWTDILRFWEVLISFF